MAKLNKSLMTLARQAGGSFKTVSDRMKIADRLAERVLKMNIQIRDANHLSIPIEL
ncbi:putative phage integrase [Yersinia pseudotuberculosis]|uniref:Putative prophage protein n=1 Tax=Yersinia pseudotuberculosis TaxID=633 RepID=Q6EVR9_YERPU|nr:putative prophage protein [Yersinia pseudotuberculosis]CNE56220.1 putative phage integrase [Yersinia pseudotuberculosis]CQH49477.1 putative phage integrase [Yersinia pseudotuberculosis]